MPKPKKFRVVEKTWDEFWAEFWRIRLIRGDEATSWKDQQVVEFCREILDLRPGMTVLDLGCGAGFQARLLAEHGIKVHGMDISPPLIRYARRMAKQHRVPATFSVGDMRTFEVEISFDRVVILGMSFGFGADAENRTTLDRVFRAVKPGGKILLTGQHPYAASNHTGPEWLETEEGYLVHRGEFNPITCRLGGWWELVCPDGTNIIEGDNPEADGIRCYTPPELKGMLESAGFVKTEFYGSWLLPPGEMQWFSSEMITVAEKPRPRSRSSRR